MSLNLKKRANENDDFSAKKMKLNESANDSNLLKCEFCSNTFANLTNLNQHVLTFHMKNSTWTCSKCKKQFTNKSNLKVHLRVHTRIKPYHCKTCNYSCMHHSSIKDHLAKNHPNVTHSSVNPAYVFNSNVVPDPDQFNSEEFNSEAFIAEAKELNNKLSAQMSDIIENNKKYSKNNSVELSPSSSYTTNYSDEASYEQSFSFEDHQYDQSESNQKQTNLNIKPKYTPFNIDSIINTNNDKQKVVANENLNLQLSSFQQPFNYFSMFQPQFSLLNQANKLQFFYSYLCNMQAIKQ